MDEKEQARQMAALEAKIEAARVPQSGGKHVDDHYTQAHMGWRMVIELVAGMLIGFGIGMGLDWLFGTLPIFLILFILLGFAAGVKTMLRTAQEAQENNAPELGASDDEKDSGRGN